MAFSWEDFVIRYQIPYRDHGPSVSRGNINIVCPWGCSPDKFKLGLHLQNGWWGCWVNAEHRGRAPHRLIMALLGCSYSTAVNIAGSKPPPDEMDDAVRLILGEDEEPEKKKHLKSLQMPAQFRPLRDQGVGSRFFNYLEGRGFGQDTHDVVKTYDLRYCVVGPWAYRIVVPIYYKQLLVGWTGRSIYKSATLRYLSLSHKKEVTPEGYRRAPLDIKDTVLFYDRAREGGRILFVVEGPVDALKLDYYLSRASSHAVALYGTSCSDTQAELLGRLTKKFDRTILLLDPGALQQQMRIESNYPHLHLQQGVFPEEWEDPGKLNHGQIKKLVNLNTRALTK